ncbi:MAG TPA: SDR family NAD(P)-dependent oxidoreductase [Actinomycetota bacterium]|nr:SDR family NAD(P)-dependent oxidoreductase [Actinomycetota bacterium]
MSLVGHAATSIADYGTDWLYVLVPVAIFAAAVAWLYAAGEPAGGGFLRRAVDRIGSSLERVTGLPAWCAGGLGTGLMALVVAVIGFLWDVAWHIDLGRDEFLLTPAHVAILLGLVMIVGAAATAITFATVRRAETGWRLGRLRVPYAAAGLAALGTGALLGFPLDEVWHHFYGIDVTMWGPTHLLMIGGASFSPIALWLLLSEAGPGAGRPALVRWLRGLLAAVVLVGLSTFQGEFDFGVPQFQQLYHPVLVSLAAGAGLVAARVALGRGGAVAAAAGFLVVRALLALLVGSVYNLTLPVPALYLGSALAVEAVYAARRLSPARRAVLAGIAVGTIGLAAEWGWTHLAGRHPWGPALWPAVLAATAIAVAGAVVGFALGRVVSFRRPGLGAIPLVLAGVVIAAALTLPFPRRTAPVTAEISTAPAGPGRIHVTARLDPPDAARGADWFEVLSWQGGGSERHPMEPAGGGTYRARGAVPVGGSWKSILRLAREDVLIATPLSMPADPEIGAPAVPVRRHRVVALQRDGDTLLREAHGGPTWPALMAYGSILALAVSWMTVLGAGFAAVARGRGGGRLVGRRILITGARGAIGTAASVALRREGASVMGFDLAPDAGVLEADVRDPAAVARAVDEAARRMGGVDTVVNNAGIGVAQDSGDPPDAGAREAMEVNLFGAWTVTAAALPYLLAERGHVVHVASGLAALTVPYAAAYTASKRALVAHGEALRLEYRGRLTVTTVLPGYVRTGIHERAAAWGASLEGSVWADGVGSAAEAIVRACADRPPRIMTGIRTAVGLSLARLFPRMTAAVVAAMARRFERSRPRRAVESPGRPGAPRSPTPL